MDLEPLFKRAAIMQESEALLSEKNKQIFEEFQETKEELAEVLFHVDDLNLSDSQYDQVFNLAIKMVPGSERVLQTLSELDDWLLESRK